MWIPHTELGARIGELVGHENHEIIVYCRSGVRSVNASEILDFHNFTRVYNMLGGILAWQSAGYPVWIATVHNVNTTFNYDTIQAAIDAPQTLDWHTILVDAGTYYEHVVVDKSISLVGESRSHTVIDGNGTGNVIYIIAHQVNVTGFTIRNGTNGIFINTFDLNIISGNIVTDNLEGIQLFSTCLCNPARKNTIRNNFIENNSIGIHLEKSMDNVIYHNNFINNTQQAYIPTYGCANLWDNGFEGNYWSDYNGTDFFSGPYWNETGSDGIGDTPHVIDADNQDNYPLMGMFSDFDATAEYTVQTVCNSTISDFQFNGTAISFNVSGENGTIGFCRICIPTTLMNGTYKVFVNGTEVPHTLLLCSNSTHSYLYFTYNHSTQEVIIIPEFPTWTAMLIVFVILTVATAIHKRRLLKTPVH